MTNSSTIRQEILKQISLIPDEQLSYILEFIQKMTLGTKQTNDNIINDPLADFIGTLEHDNLADNDDEDIENELLDISATALQNYITGKDKGISDRELKRQLLGEDFA